MIVVRSASSGMPWLRAASWSSSSEIPVLTAAWVVLAVGGLLDHAEQLADAAHEQPLLVDLDPDAGGRGEDDVVADLHRHRDAGRLPPVDAGADRQHDPVLRRRLVVAGGHDAGPERRTRSGSSSFMTTRSKSGCSWLRILP